METFWVQTCQVPGASTGAQLPLWLGSGGEMHWTWAFLCHCFLNFGSKITVERRALELFLSESAIHASLEGLYHKDTTDFN